MIMKLFNKKAIVTGASRSIGKAIAHAFAEQGADVVISYRSNDSGAKETVAAIHKLGRASKAIYADFSHPEKAARFFEEALEFLGKVDILVNNAAEYDTTPFLDLDVVQFSHLLNVNVSIPMFLTQLAAKYMIQKRIKGTIINISAISGTRPYPNRVAHGTAKAALNMLTRTTALELAPYGIRVNGIAPGATPYEKNPIDKDSLAAIPLNRMGLPEDQAQAALFLASDDSSWATGQILTIDGGQSL
jgi:NAD(P)-dependent dehydrogenase (short-subunit alcohol dehydrogenase family)